MPGVVMPSRCKRRPRRRLQSSMALLLVLVVTAAAAESSSCPALESEECDRPSGRIGVDSSSAESKASASVIRQRLIALERRFVCGQQQLGEPWIVFFQLRDAGGQRTNDTGHYDDDDSLAMALESFTRLRSRVSIIFRFNPPAQTSVASEVLAAIGSNEDSGSAVLVFLLPDLAADGRTLVEQASRAFPLATKLLLLTSAGDAAAATGGCECPDEREAASARAFLRDLWRTGRTVSVTTVWYRCPDACGTPVGLFDPFAYNQPAETEGTGCRDGDLADLGAFHIATDLHRTAPTDTSLLLRPKPPVLNLNGAALDIYGFDAAMAYRRDDIDMMPRTFPPSTLPKRPACHPPAPWNATSTVLDGLFGADIEALRELAERINFTPRVHHTAANFGFRTDNGSFTGVLGHLVTARNSWLSMNVYFLKDYETRDVQFTAAVYQDSLCVFVKAAGMLPDWLLIFRCFTPTLWIMLFGTIALVCLCYVVLTQFISAHLEPGRRRERQSTGNVFTEPAAVHRDTIGLMAQIVGALLNAPTNGIDRTTSHQKLFVAFALIWGMTITGAFQGSLVDVYTTPTSMKNLDTLEELDESGLPIMVNAPALIVDVFGTEGPGNTIGNLKQRLVVDTTPFKPAVYFVLEGVAVALTRNQDFLRIQTKHLGEDGTALLHRLRECPRSYALAYLYPRGSPLYRAANWHILHFLQHGLYTKWQRDATHTLAMNRALKMRYTEAHHGIPVGQGGQVQLRLDHLLLPFMLLATGLALSSLCFACEHIRSRRSHLRDSVR